MDVLGAALDGGVPGDRVVVRARTGAGWRAWTLDDLESATGGRGEELRAAGARAGVAWPAVVRPDLDGVLTLLALARVGAVAAPLNDALPPAEAGRARRALSGRELPGHAVLWTSGTSGRARGVLLPWGAFQASADAAARRLELVPGDVWLASLSPAHVGGLALVYRSFLLGSALVLAGRLDADGLAGLLAGDGAGPTPTHLSLVPTQLHRLLERWGDAPAPPGLRCVLLGGAHAPAELLDRALGAGWPVALTYGMTEMASQVATAPPAAVRADPRAGLPPLDGVQVDLDPSGALRVRGPTMAVGYVDGPDPTPVADPDGWYATGDLAEIDADGRIRVVGRRSDRIVSGGVTVHAQEVEEELRAHPRVADAAVVGLDDPVWGEVVSAAVVRVGGPLEPGELDAWLRPRVQPAKRPRAWTFVEALPRNSNGKVDRRAVRALLAGRRGAGGDDPGGPGRSGRGREHVPGNR